MAGTPVPPEQKSRWPADAVRTTIAIVLLELSSSFFTPFRDAMDRRRRRRRARVPEKCLRYPAGVRNCLYRAENGFDTARKATRFTALSEAEQDDLAHRRGRASCLSDRRAVGQERRAGQSEQAD